MVEMREEDILACQLPVWYEKFRPLTFKTRIIKLSDEAVRYFESDGICVGSPSNASSHSGFSGGGDGGADGSDWDECEDVLPPKELEAEIEQAIEALKGEVFPKLNWSAPKDCRWMSPGGTLQCHRPDEVFMFLKSSDFVAHDMRNAFDLVPSASRTRPDDFYVCLRRFHQLNPASEFRVFVREGKLAAISQRDAATFYPFMAEFRSEAEAKIRSFFDEHIAGQFPLDSYVFDVYIDVPPRRKVWLIDFSPVGPSTEALLFDWEEKPLKDDGPFEFRIVEDEQGKLPQLERFHAVPKDLAELSGKSGKELAEMMEKAEANLKKQEEALRKKEAEEGIDG